MNLNRPPLANRPSPMNNAETNHPTALIAHSLATKKRKNAGIRILEWWYRLTAPQEVPETAPLAIRERVRRGQLISAVMLCAAIMFTLGETIGIFGPNHFIALAILFPFFMIFIAVFFNRHGKTGIAGFIIPAGLNVALIVVILSSPLTPSSIQLYDLLAFVEIFAISLLPPNGWILSCFVVFNLVFIQADITLQPHTVLFATMIASDNVLVRIRPVIIHVVLAGVMWLWVKSANSALARADRAEVIANLEHTVAEQERVVAQQKGQLDQGIQSIVDTHVQVANGNLSARVPLVSGNVLWQVAGPLNNLLSRFQRLNEEAIASRQFIQEYPRVRDALSQAIYRIKAFQAGRNPGPIVRTGTIVDPLLETLDPILQSQEQQDGHYTNRGLH